MEIMPRTEYLSFAGAAESCSTHPIATSIMEEVKKRRLEIPEVKDIKEISGKGMEVTLDDGMLLCGNIELLTMKGIEVPSKAKEIYGTEGIALHLMKNTLVI